MRATWGWAIWGWMGVALLVGTGCASEIEERGPEGGAHEPGTEPPVTDEPAAPPGEGEGGESAPRPLPGPAPSEPPVEAPPFTCEGKTGVDGRRVISFMHDGLLRTTYLHVPDQYEPTEGTMLVLNFHGFTSADWQQALLTGMGEVAEERGFIVAYPQGVAASWNAGDCCGTAWTDSVDDVGFVQALIERLAEDYCVDPRRIHATGMSNGGFISHRLACELSDTIASIAPVAGVIGVDPGECAPERPMPVWQFHGTRDPLVPYEGGTPILHDLGVGVVFRSVADTLEHWATVNGCSLERSQMIVEGDTTCVAWADCDAPTRLCTVDGGGHTWPGGLPIPFLGRTTNDLDATRQMVAFFEDNPLPAR